MLLSRSAGRSWVVLRVCGLGHWGVCSGLGYWMAQWPGELTADEFLDSVKSPKGYDII